MTSPVRVALLLASLVAAGSLLVPASPATAEGVDGPLALLGEAAAITRARETGMPTVVSALTDEHTLVTADPLTGSLTADLSANVARVRDGAAGWRTPSAALIQAPDGSFRPEAPAVPLVVSGGGTGPFLTLGEGENSVNLTWPGLLPAPIVHGDLATYEDVTSGVDLVVRASVDGAESFLVVKTASAAQNSLVRSMPIEVHSDGLAASTSASGAAVYSDQSGNEVFSVPPAYVWDSSGQPADAGLAELLQPADGAAVETLPAHAAETKGRLSYAMDSSGLEMLDDPSTTYPVIIDPSVTGDQSYAVRVTGEFNQYNSGIGSRGKIGYNGWTSPYYKSRMYYQFHWPTVNGDPVSANRIISAQFSYVQTHSPQHDCGDHDFGPAVKVQFHYVISSDTTWSDQPDVHPNIGSVSNDYAVGHEDYCGDAYTQKWDVTSMAEKERTNYETRTTVTVGVRSADESDKNGWREYWNSDGSSPKLTVVYQVNPVTPPAPSFTPTMGSGLTDSLTPTLSANLPLKSGDVCGVTACLNGKFTLKDSAGTVRWTGTAPAVANGAAARIAVPAGILVENQTYTVTVQGVSVDTGLVSPVSPATSITPRLTPPAPTALTVLTGTGGTTTPPSTNTSHPRLRATLPAGTWCRPEEPACLQIQFVVRNASGASVYESQASAKGAPGTVVTTEPLPASVSLVDGSYTLQARTIKAVNGKSSAYAGQAFGVTLPIPDAPILTDRGASSGTTLRIHVSMPNAQWQNYIYLVRVDVDSGDGAVTCTYEGDTSCTLEPVIGTPEMELEFDLPITTHPDTAVNAQVWVRAQAPPPGTAISVESATLTTLWWPEA